MNKKQARRARKARNATKNYYIMKHTLSGSTRLDFNFYDKRIACNKCGELNHRSDSSGILFVVEVEKRTNDISYEI